MTRDSAEPCPPLVDRGDGVWEGSVRFQGDEPYFEDHFPGFPVTPGVLLFEAMRNAAATALAGEEGPPRLERATHVRFLQPCPPPIELRITVQIRPGEDLVARCEVRNLEDRKMATARMVFGRPRPPEGAS